MEKLIHISSGRGPLECAWVVKKTFSLLQSDANACNLKLHVLERTVSSHPSGINSLTLLLSGKNGDEFITQWEGSILWIGKSQFRPQHRRKNWFIEIFGLDAPTVFNLKPEDIVFQSTKSSGPGGQHVNKTMSAIRATHRPTGVSVFVQDTRSQHQNKLLATQRLEAELNKKNIAQFQNFESEQWKKKINVQRGNPKRTFVGIAFEPKN